jgi:hypothetical protein
MLFIYILKNNFFWIKKLRLFLERHLEFESRLGAWRALMLPLTPMAQMRPVLLKDL